MISIIGLRGKMPLASSRITEAMFYIIALSMPRDDKERDMMRLSCRFPRCLLPLLAIYLNATRRDKGTDFAVEIRCHIFMPPPSAGISLQISLMRAPMPRRQPC